MQTPDNAPSARGLRISASDLSQLTPREREVLALIGQGLSSKEIAGWLHRSIKTVQTHRSALGRKLGASNRVELARIAIHTGLITATSLPGDQRSAAAGVRSDASDEVATLLDRVNGAIGSMTGVGLFRTLVRNLVNLVDVKCACVCEVIDDGRKVRAIACWTKAGPVADLECALKDSPLEDAHDRLIVGARHNARDLFPSIQLFQDLSIESFLGSPIRDARGMAIGLLALFDDKPIQESPELNLLLTSFAHRCGAEIQRLHTERMLRENQAQLQQAYERNPVPAYTWKIVGEDLMLESYNDAALTSTDGHVRNLIGTSAREFFLDRPDILEDLERCIRQRTTYRRETEYSPKAIGEQRYMAFTFSFLSPDRVLVHTEDITARRRAEEALRESRALLANAAKLAHLGHWHQDLVNDISSWSDETARIFGIDPSAVEHEYEFFLSRVHPEDRELVGHAVEAAKSNGVPIDIEYRIIRPDGSERRIHSLGQVQVNENGNAVTLTGTIQDITERKRIEDAHKASEGRLSAILDTAVDAIVTIDAAGIIETANASASRMFGYPVEELIGRSVKVLMPDPFRSAHDDYLSRYLTTGERKIIGIGREVIGRRKDGTTFPVDLAVSEMRVKNRCLFTGILRDISDRIHALQEARQAQARMEHLLSVAPVAMYVYKAAGDRSATYISSNTAAICGFEARDFLDNSNLWIDRVHAEDRPRLLADLKKLIETDQQTHEYRFRHKNGRYIWVRDEVKLIRDADNNPLEIVGCWTEISKRRNSD